MYTQQTMNLVCSANNRPQVLKTSIGKKVLSEPIGKLDWIDDMIEMEELADEFGNGIFID